jgi:hypothetical protein
MKNNWTNNKWKLEPIIFTFYERGDSFERKKNRIKLKKNIRLRWNFMFLITCQRKTTLSVFIGLKQLEWGNFFRKKLIQFFNSESSIGDTRHIFFWCNMETLRIMCIISANYFKWWASENNEMWKFNLKNHCLDPYLKCHKPLFEFLRWFWFFIS